MSTTMPKAGEISRKWYVLDAADKPLGDHVIIINVEKAVLTGKKLEQKYYRHHTGWIGGLKETRYDKLMKENPEKAMMLAVKGMLPSNTIGANSLKRCRVFKGAEHTHAAQNPETWSL